MGKPRHPHQLIDIYTPNYNKYNADREREMIIIIDGVAVLCEFGDSLHVAGARY